MAKTRRWLPRTSRRLRQAVAASLCWVIWGTSDVQDGKRPTEHRMVAEWPSAPGPRPVGTTENRAGDPPNTWRQPLKKCETRAHELFHPVKREQWLLQGMSDVLPSEPRRVRQVCHARSKMRAKRTCNLRGPGCQSQRPSSRANGSFPKADGLLF